MNSIYLAFDIKEKRGNLDFKFGGNNHLPFMISLSFE